LSVRLNFFPGALAHAIKAKRLIMDNCRADSTPSSGSLAVPNVGHVLAAFDALRVSQVLVYDLIGELEGRCFDMSASIRAFDLAVMDGLLCWSTGIKLIKPQP
jgi:hypothetical protein